jgi:hypothetical protein
VSNPNWETPQVQARLHHSFDQDQGDLDMAMQLMVH